MDKLAKVINGLGACIKGDCRENACPYALKNECRKSLEMDALELLKEQQSAYERGKRDGVSQYLREREEDEEYEC
jgi:hypothetical protein